MAVRKTNALIALIVLVVSVIFFGTLFRNLRESELRSLQLKEAPVAGNQFGISFRIVSINPATSEMTARVSFLVTGSLAKDPITPATDLKLILNGIRGQQEFIFPRGKRMNSVMEVFAVDGNSNHYPFDRYISSIRIMVTKRVPSRGSPVPAGKETSNAPFHDEQGESFLGAQEGEPLPIASSITASIPGLKFEGERVERINQGIEGFNLTVRRADNVIVVSVLIMALMMSLALSVLLMSFSAVTSHREIELLPLSLCISLLFGLPALRNAQPAVPSLGVLGDYVSFIWAEMIVSVSAVMIIWTWMIRRRHSATTIADRQEKDQHGTRS